MSELVHLTIVFDKRRAQLLSDAVRDASSPVIVQFSEDYEAMREDAEKKKQAAHTQLVSVLKNASWWDNLEYFAKQPE